MGASAFEAERPLDDIPADTVRYATEGDVGRFSFQLRNGTDRLGLEVSEERRA